MYERKGLFASSYPRIRLRHARQTLDTKLIRHDERTDTLKDVHVFLQAQGVSPELLREFERKYDAFLFEPEKGDTETS